MTEFKEKAQLGEHVHLCHLHLFVFLVELATTAPLYSPLHHFIRFLQVIDAPSHFL
jgi:hypothetical protein